MKLQFVSDWKIHECDDGNSVVFNPFTGDLHALSELSGALLWQLKEREMSGEELFAELNATYPNLDTSVLAQDVRLSVSKLLELAVICICKPS